MRHRPPLILWRLLTSELLRSVLLTCAILVVSIAFVIAIKPLADGDLDPAQTLRFMALAIVPMLQFALPFSAGFGATLAFHRFAADNEALAAMVGGVSHRALLAPAAISGLVLALVLALLTNAVIPTFFRSMERLVSRDVARMLVNASQSGRAVRLPEGVIVHADRANHLGRDPDAGPGAPDRLVLEGVVAVQSGAGGLEREAVAERAGVWIYDGGMGDDRALAVIRLYGATVSEAGQAAWDAGTTDFRVAAPGGHRERPRFYSTPALRTLEQEPQRIGAVETRRRALIATLERRRVEEQLRAALREDGAVRLIDAQGQSVSVRAAAIADEGRQWRLVPHDAAGVELIWRLEGDRARLQTVGSAVLRIDDPGRSPDDAPLTLTLELENIATHDAAGAGRPRQSRAAIGPLTTPDAAASPLLRMSVAELLDHARARPDRAPAVVRAADALDARVRDLFREITSYRHERLAYSVACFVMVLAGAVAGMRLRDSRPLLVYTWSFFPGVLALITIGAGQNLAHKSGPVGLLLLWGGVACLLIFTAVDYRRLRKH
ncbi:MAG: LptF/LptG family permease [Phycisphaerales bacterium]|nr:MAG: LptF/LptG family permease [Phycisphaerales bacterium]